MIQNQARELTKPANFVTPTISAIDASAASDFVSRPVQNRPSDQCILLPHQSSSTVIEGYTAGGEGLSIQAWQWNSETGELDYVGEESACNSQAGEVSNNAPKNAQSEMTDNNRLLWLCSSKLDFESCSDEVCLAVRRQCCAVCEMRRLCSHCSGAIRSCIGLFTISHQEEPTRNHSMARSLIADLRRVGIRMCQSCLEMTNSGTPGADMN